MTWPWNKNFSKFTFGMRTDCFLCQKRNSIFTLLFKGSNSANKLNMNKNWKISDHLPREAAVCYVRQIRMNVEKFAWP